MFYKNKNYESAIETVKIEFGTSLGLEKDEEAFVVLKELPAKKMMELQKAADKGESDLIDFFEEVLPGIIKTHNLMEDEEKRMSNEDVVALIYEKFDLTVKVVTAYSNAAFFTRMNKKRD